MSQKVPGKIVLAYDLGGTKVSVGVVNSNGQVLDEVRQPVVLEQGKSAVIQQLAQLGKNFLALYPKIRKVGIASAGPLDPIRGILLDPTNFKTAGKTWGKVPLASLLSHQLHRPVTIENDAAAAILAEHWIGAARRYRNAMILTLGTGLGTGIICNGKLVRAGRGLHPEAGHIIIQHHDKNALCGCGNFGCSEAYLAGKNFERRARIRLKQDQLTAKDIADLARKKDPIALEIFEEYASNMAVAIHNYVVIYAPEIIVFTGSFAESAELFLDSTQQHLNQLLTRRRIGIDLMPRLKLSSLKNNAGLIGGAYIAMHQYNPL